METSDHLGTAEGYLQQCDQDLEECRMILDTLEGILEITPKPSECLA